MQYTQYAISTLPDHPQKIIAKWNGNSIKLYFVRTKIYPCPNNNIIRSHLIECEAFTIHPLCHVRLGCVATHGCLSAFILIIIFNCCLRHARTRKKKRAQFALVGTCLCHVKHKYFRNGFMCIIFGYDYDYDIFML